MKRITKLSLFLAVSSLSVGGLTTAAVAGEGHECTWDGTITAVNVQDKLVTAKGWYYTRTFDVGAQCGMSALDKPQAGLADLRPGDRVRIRYQTSGGVRVADRIDERSFTAKGTVQDVDPKTGLVTLEAAPLHHIRLNERTFHAANDCKIALWNGKNGSMADVRRGDNVTVAYEMPNGAPMAYSINDYSRTFTGRLQAADTADHVVKAGDKAFSLADDCRISASGQENAPVTALQLGQDYTFTYHELNGVNVADRITFAPQTTSKASQGLNPAPGMYGANY